MCLYLPTYLSPEKNSEQHIPHHGCGCHMYQYTQNLVTIHLLIHGLLKNDSNLDMLNDRKITEDDMGRLWKEAVMV